MPLYDVNCPEHGLMEDVFVPLAEYSAAGAECPECGAVSPRKISAVMTVGPMPSKPIETMQIGRSIESNAELRKYQKENPGVGFLDKNDSMYRKHYDKVREKCDATARKAGFVDHDHKKAHNRRENKKRRELGG